MIEKITRKEVLNRIAQKEKEGKFDEHVDPIDPDGYIPVDEHFEYFQTKAKKKFNYWWKYHFIVSPFIKKLNKKTIKTIVYGLENTKGIDSSIVVSNHVYMFDCLAQAYAFKGHKLYTTAAEFNNQKGPFGELMRIGGMLPLAGNVKGMRNFIRAVDTHLRNKHYVMFYPETAMWWLYEKPRPFAIGAFHFAVRNNVPVIPSFITFNKLGTFDKEGIEEKQFVINILKPIYPRNDLPTKENEEYLKNEAFKAFKEKYEEFYHKPLEY